MATDHHPHLHQFERDVEGGLTGQSAPYGEMGTATPPRIVEPSHDGSSPNQSHTGFPAPSGTATAVGSRPSSLKNVKTTSSDSHSHHDLDAEKIKEGAELDGTPEEEQPGVLTGLKLYLVFLALMLSVFMFALDQSIVSTAIPQIVSSFQAFDEVSWIITGYFLTQCGLILLAGQLLTVVKAKWVLMGAIFFFELGSLLCGVANSMPLLIFGRAIQGIGASGMFVSILAVIAVITTLSQRPAFMSAFGIVFVISSVVGPLLGGVFTERVSWRWCFYINLPIGGIAAVAVIFLLPAKEPKHEGNAPVEKGWRGALHLDYLGAALIMIIITCLLLALQWGGNNYPWGNWRIILLFVLAGVLIPVFLFWQKYLDKRALVPLALLRNRTQLACSACMFLMMAGMLGGTYQLPLYYQAGRNHSPQQSGIDIIAFMLATCVGIFVSGGGATASGRYWPFLVAGSPIACVGFGLLYTLTPETPNAKIIGFQILSGFGVGLSFQNALIAIQAEYHDRLHLLPQATGVVSFFQLTGAAIGIGIVNTVQSIYLNSELKALAPDAPFELVRQSTTAIYELPVEMQGPVIQAYVIAITKSLIPLIASLGLAFIAALFVRNHNMKKMGIKPGATAA